jgi:hypothetical protein
MLQDFAYALLFLFYGHREVFRSADLVAFAADFG